MLVAERTGTLRRVHDVWASRLELWDAVALIRRTGLRLRVWDAVWRARWSVWLPRSNLLTCEAPDSLRRKRVSVCDV